MVADCSDIVKASGLNWSCFFKNIWFFHVFGRKKKGSVLKIQKPEGILMPPAFGKVLAAVLFCGADF